MQKSKKDKILFSRLFGDSYKNVHSSAEFGKIPLRISKINLDEDQKTAKNLLHCRTLQAIVEQMLIKDFENEKNTGSVRMKSILWGRNKSKLESLFH